MALESRVAAPVDTPEPHQHVWIITVMLAGIRTKGAKRKLHKQVTYGFDDL